jgi:hypothetical protein
MILRSDNAESYSFIGNSVVNGLEDGKELLGPLPDGWILVINWEYGQFNPVFKNTETNECFYEDPRLVDMDDDWECINEEAMKSSMYAVRRYKHKVTGETCVGDPRMTPDALRARGVPIETISLV